MDDNASLLLERFNRSWKEIDRVYHEIARRSGCPTAHSGFCTR